MEPITATLTTAKEIYEAAKTIQKVYNVSREIKTVAESEGKDQIIATKDLTGTASKIKQEGVSDKRGSSNKESNIKEGNLHHSKTDEPDFPKSHFVYQLDSTHVEPATTLEPNEIQNNKDVFVDRLSSSENSASATEQNGVLSGESPKESSQNMIEESKLSSTEVLESWCEEKPEGLTEQEKQEIKGKTGWSDKIVDAIRTKEEAQVYIDAGVVEGEINGKPALLQPKIDGKACNEPKWSDWNNKDLAEEGYPPRDENGRPYELHHIGQKQDSPLVELTFEQHRSDGNFKILHKFDESSIDRVQFNNERKEYWSERSKSL